VQGNLKLYKTKLPFMQKIFLIIQREFLTRVRKKTFIIGTLLFPLLYVLLIVGQGYIADKTREQFNIALIDNSTLFNAEKIKELNVADSNNLITLINSNSENVIKNYDSLGYNGYIVIPQNFNWKTGTDSLLINTKKTYGFSAVEPLSRKINTLWDGIKNDSLGIGIAQKEILAKEINVKFNNTKDTKANSGIASTIGYVCGFLMYIILLLYGSQVMMGVTEEKTNRIAEVVVSSVKPFQLMIGKIIGIGAVAVTQFLIWIACIFLIYNVGKNSGNTSGFSQSLGMVQEVFTSVNIPITIGCFLFYLIGGFFFYSSLYAAIGSAINEDMREAQSLSFPITMLIIFSIALMTPTISNPSSPVAVWSSIIPFTSPIVMMARIPFGVPNTVHVWQLALSMVLLIAGFLFTTWFAGKIYKTGILMYGKKPSWKEMIKWAFTK
jgi:ABC-2 type transport system permease protein